MAIKEENSCVAIKQQTKRIKLHPYHLNDINESIKNIFYKRIGRYDKKLDGILLSYKNAKILDNLAPIYDDNCFMSIDVSAEFRTFKPELDSILQGVAIKKSKDHIGALVHEVFNVSIPKIDENWLGNKVAIGQEISMKIVHINLDGRLPYIKAELLSILGGGKIDALSNSLSKITKFIDDEEEELSLTTEQNVSQIDPDNVVEEIETKKSKKKKSTNETINETPKSSKHDLEEALSQKKKRKRSLSESFAEEPTKKKKKKSKHREEDQEIGNSQETDIVLPELNLEKILRKEPTLQESTYEMVDVEEKIVRKRKSSMSFQWGDRNFELPYDSDLEKILSSQSKRSKGLSDSLENNDANKRSPKKHKSSRH